MRKVKRPLASDFASKRSSRKIDTCRGLLNRPTTRNSPAVIIA